MRAKIREREKERECVCVRERERERERTGTFYGSCFMAPHFTNWYIMDLCTTIMRAARAALHPDRGPRGLC
jgi:hypothetical protein